MPGLCDSQSEKALSLTQEEAFALLEMCTLTLANESPVHLMVLSRLGSLCREMLSPDSEKEEPLPDIRLSLPMSRCSQESPTVACLF